MPEDEWTAILDTNLTGTLRACQVFGKHMLDRGYGRIVNIASLNSFVALKRSRGLRSQQKLASLRSRVPSPSSGQRKALQSMPLLPEYSEPS